MIPHGANTVPVSPGADWAAGIFVYCTFMADFFSAGYLSLRAAQRVLGPTGKLPVTLSVLWILFCFAGESGIGRASLQLWGLGHLLAARPRPTPRPDLA